MLKRDCLSWLARIAACRAAGGCASFVTSDRPSRHRHPSSPCLSRLQVLIKYIDEVSACILDARSAAAALCTPVSRADKVKPGVQVPVLLGRVVLAPRFALDPAQGEKETNLPTSHLRSSLVAPLGPAIRRRWCVRWTRCLRSSLRRRWAW